MTDIIANPDKPWYWENISQNPNLTIYYIIANPDKTWDWYVISRNPNITMTDILDIYSNPNKP
jgi:hypothetical protein